MKKTYTRRDVLAAGVAATAIAALPSTGSAQGLEKKKITIAVGGKNLLYYLPLTIAEQKKFFEQEGLDVTIVDFAGGARALQAVVGGSADVVSGAWIGGWVGVGLGCGTAVLACGLGAAAVGSVAGSAVALWSGSGTPIAPNQRCAMVWAESGSAPAWAA